MAGTGAADGKRSVGDRDGGRQSGGNNHAGIDHSPERVAVISTMAGGSIGEVSRSSAFIADKSGTEALDGTVPLFSFQGNEATPGRGKTFFMFDTGAPIWFAMAVKHRPLAA